MRDFVFPYVPTPGDTVDWTAISRQYVWLAPLVQTPQDPIYHAEGDVAEHTRLVLAALVQSIEWQQLGPIDRGVLFWAAMLHDIAKPLCTLISATGRILTPNHTIKGEHLAREILYKDLPEPFPFHLREKVVQLVRHHGFPFWLLDQDKPLKKVIRASLSVNLRYLATLAEADARGRVCDDGDAFLERIHLFRQYAMEAGCYASAYPFETDLARWVYCNTANNVPTYQPYDTTWGPVILMSGLPGAGKDTWIQANASHLPIVSLDTLRAALGVSAEQNQGIVIQAAKNQAKVMLRKHNPFVWNATNVTRYMRKSLIDLFMAYGAKVHIVYVESDYKTLLMQNKNREDAVPEPVMERLIRKLDVPLAEETNGEIQYFVMGPKMS